MRIDGAAHSESFMNTRTFLSTCLFVLLALAPWLRAEGLPAEEKTRIEALLTHVAELSDAKFIRNGKEYDAKSAARFLRRKWEANEKQIHSAQSFIKVAATQSSTTGKPYLIRFKDGTTTPCAEYLTARLAKLLNHGS